MRKNSHQFDVVDWIIVLILHIGKGEPAWKHTFK